MVIDGRKIAEEILEETKNEIQKSGLKLKLAAVLVGGHAESRKFLKLKEIAAKKIGIDFRLYEFPANITTQELHKEITNIIKVKINSGIIIELPLPKHINAQYILNAVPEEKDPDVLSQKAQGVFFANRSPILPPAVEAVRVILRHSKINLKGKNCTVFGYGLLVGKPVSHWLASQGTTVSIVNEFTPNPADLSRTADIIVSGVDKPNLVTADMVKDGAIVIDFAKDVDFEKVASKASFITPPIGGVGPIVVAAVLKNLIILANKKAP